MKYTLRSIRPILVFALLFFGYHHSSKAVGKDVFVDETIDVTNTYDYIRVYNGATLTIKRAFPIIPVNVNITNIGESVIVYPGGTLIIEGNATLHMGTFSGSIAVMSQYKSGTVNHSQEGGRLILDNGKILGSSWQGVYVWGDKRVSQFLLPASNKVTVGRIDVLNGSEISGSYHGICNYDRHSDLNAANSGGGIVFAEHSTFKNHSVAMRFEHYQNFNPTTLAPMDDRSKITQCQFIYDLIGSDVSTQPFAYFVYAHDVEGVKVFGSTFDYQWSSPSPISTGIRLEDAGIIVYNDCPPPPLTTVVYTDFCTGIVRSTFKGLSYGIKGYKLSGVRAVTIRNAVFEDIANEAIGLQGFTDPFITRNNISLLASTSQPSKGIILEACPSFRVEENLIQSAATASTQAFGIVINSSGELANTIYKNEIRNLNYAIQTNGINREPGGDVGLLLLCNNMATSGYNNSFDIDVNVTTTGIDGIALNQMETVGPDNLSAANLFSSKMSPTPGTNNFTDPDNVIYFYNLMIAAENPVHRSPSVFALPIGAAHPCETRIDPLFFCPYCGEEGPNPDSRRASDTIYEKYLNARRSLEQEINDVENGVKTLGNIQSSSLYQSYSKLTTDYINYLLYYENPEVRKGRMIKILEDVKYGINFKFWLASVYAQENRFDDAFSALDHIGSGSGLNKEQNDVFASIRSLVSIQEQIVKNGWENTNESVKADLHHMAENGAHYARYWSRSLLAIHDQRDFDGDVTIKDQFAHRPSGLEQLHDEHGVALSPNPVIDDLHIKINGYSGVISAAVYDVTGRVMKTIDFNGARTSTVSLRELSSGTYFVSILNNGIAVEQFKIVKQ